MTTKNAPVPDPLASEDGGFDVFLKKSKPSHQAAGAAADASKAVPQPAISADQQNAHVDLPVPPASSVWDTEQSERAAPAPSTPPVPSLNTGGAASTKTHFAPTSVLVGAEIALRIEYYQAKEKRRTGAEPKITPIVLTALNHCYDEQLSTYRRLVQKRQQPAASTVPGPFTGAAVGRRTDSRNRLTIQLSIRPTLQELEMIDSFCQHVEGQSRSEFVDAVLEEFLGVFAADMPKGFKSKRQLGTIR